MTGRHALAGGDECRCPDTQMTHTCEKLGTKPNHNYDENAAQAQTEPLSRVNSVDWPPSSVGD